MVHFKDKLQLAEALYYKNMNVKTHNMKGLICETRY